MKKIMMTLAAVLCCAMISTVFTSCSKSDDEPDLYYYQASGNISAVNAGMGGLFIITDYTTAIQQAVGTGSTTQNDQKVISACDAVYSSHKAEYGTSISGTVKIVRTKLGDNSETTIKEYTY